ncbi:putative spermidine/putrescine transport system substrate-binding protein [Actimicrobium sp. GrIS 1.19]|uniref:extracellular solute-binding protein n=1 Tax=Actimicrobium sp. GrIS 1.19 TaxID=3071708 RepID=UPI002DF88822|nr:putative spermidine/putrescine transport system substrate-binding protein [Actimicrobium sp. GrIS 1.19]
MPFVLSLKCFDHAAVCRRAVGFLLLFAMLNTCRADGAVLRILAWPGYADPDVVAAFEKKSGARAEVNYVDTDDELWLRMNRNGGGDYDVYAVNTAELQRYIDKGLSAPLGVSDIPGQSNQMPRFRNPAAIPGLMRGKRLYGIPYAYAEMGLIYNRKLVKTAPTSFDAMWDPAWRGRVLAYNGSTHNFSLAALVGGSTHPFNQSDAELRASSQRLVNLRRNVLGFYSSPDEAVQLFMRHEVALVFANYGSQQLEALRAAGADVGYVVPAAGALAWLDCWVISSRSRSPALAAQWIDFSLQPEVSAILSTRHGLSNTVTPATAGSASDTLVWLQPPEDYAQRQRLWSRILSGDAMRKY